MRHEEIAVGMDRDQILQAIQEAFTEALPDQSLILKPKDDLVDLGLASVAVLEMAASLETRFNILLTEEQLAELRTVDDFISLVQKQLDEGA